MQDTARLWKEREVILSQFAGGVVQLVRTTACHAGGRGLEPVAPAKFDEKNWFPRLGMSLVQLSRLPHEHNLARSHSGHAALLLP